MNEHVLLKALELAGWDGPKNSRGWLNRVDRFAELVTALERERCAKVADDHDGDFGNPSNVIAEEIRGNL